MDSPFAKDIELSNEDDSFDLLQDIERQTGNEIRRLRAHERLCIKMKVLLQSGNSSQLLDYKVQGITGDISEGGCQAMFPVPIQVGDIYRLQFCGEELDVSLVFARCIRCKLIREDAYEAGFSFFNPIQIPVSTKCHADSELL